MKTISYSFVIVFAFIASIASAQNNPFNMLNVPFTDVDPFMDGMATDNPEWARATRVPDTFFFGDVPRSGFYYFQNRLDWEATSVQTDEEEEYPGTTMFVAHDIIGSSDTNNPLHQFQVDDDNDWNSFEFRVPGGKATIWVFDDEDDSDDSDWLPFAEGLDQSSLIPEGTAPNLIDDRGFIARLNDDPSTDVHWFEGLPEPGDPGWDWADWHYVFGRHTFGQSFQDVLLDTDPENAVDHEVYEFCAYQPDWTNPPPPPPPPPPWCIWWDLEEEETITTKWIITIKDGRPVKTKVKVSTKKLVPILRGQFWLHFWDPEVFAVGNPTFVQHGNHILGRLMVIINENPGTGAMYLNLAGSSLQNAIVQLDQGQWQQSLAAIKEAGKFLKSAKKMGVDPRDLLDFETQTLSLFTDEANQWLISLDQQLPMDHPGLQAAYAAMNKFGDTLRKATAKPEKFDAMKTIGALRKVFSAIEAGQPTKK